MNLRRGLTEGRRRKGHIGLHVMVHKHEELLAEIIRDSGIRELAARSQECGGG